MKPLIQEIDPIKNEIGFNSLLAISSIRRSGDIALLWKDSITVDSQTFSLNHIDVYISAYMQEQWRLTGVYGHLEDQRKKETWALMRHLQSWTMKPWVCIVDFNEVLRSNEKRGGLAKLLSMMQEFWGALLHCDLTDLGLQGYTYTWRNGRFGDDFVEQCLDRACANSKWRKMFLMARVTHHTASYSDHDPITLNIDHDSSRSRRRRKMQWFEEKWVAHVDCEELIQAS